LIAKFEELFGFLYFLLLPVWAEFLQYNIDLCVLGPIVVTPSITKNGLFYFLLFPHEKSFFSK
jgi:hypothetical protein